MSVFAPRVRPYARSGVSRGTAPSGQEMLALREASELRERDRRERVRPLLVRSGLADVEAAVACLCGCHPRAADPDLHAGGRECACQLTPAQRQERWSAVSAEFSDVRAALDDEESGLRAEALAVAQELGAEIDQVGGLVPFVIRGRVDGRGFYVRSRHEQFTVEIAPDEDPLADPGSLGALPGFLVAEGPADELLGLDASWAAAVRVAVDAVRVSLRRRGCSHQAPVDAWFCPWCGERLSSCSD